MLVLFGDSFASVHPTGPNKTWFELLAEKLGINYKSYAVDGSSFEYSTLKFYEYLQTDWSPDDIIIFILTSITRSPVIKDDFNPSCAAAMGLLASGITLPDTRSFRDPHVLDVKEKSHRHFVKYKHYYTEWLNLQNEDLILAQRFMLLKCLHSLSNKTLSISGWEFERKISDNFADHINASLSSISLDEIKNGNILDFVNKHGRDFRRNHLHEHNHHVLSDLIYKKLTGEDIEFSTELFHKNVYEI